MIDLPYSLVIEATSEPDFFGFYSPELEGFAGIGHSVEDCLSRARWAMKEHLELLADQQLPIPPRNNDPVVTIRNEMKEPPVSLGAAQGGSADLLQV
jgi:predicted RNase H-like HicB family nuclease